MKRKLKNLIRGGYTMEEKKESSGSGIGIERMLFCQSGNRQFVIRECDITTPIMMGNTDIIRIHSSVAYAIDAIPTKVIGPKGTMQITFNISAMHNVIMQCNYISDLPEGDQIREEIIKLAEKIAREGKQ